MIDMNFIRGYFPQQIRDNAQFSKDMLKEYIQFMILDFISTTPYARKLAFIGGTNLRLIKGIDRFSEDLDFDCKNMSKEEFMTLTDDILVFLQRSGLDAVVKDMTDHAVNSVVARIAEAAKVAVRSIRRDAIEQIKKMKKDSAITEDEQRKGEEDMQKITDKAIKEIEAIYAAKEKEIMEV